MKFTLTVTVTIHNTVTGQAAAPRSSTVRPWTTTCWTAPPVAQNARPAATSASSLYVDHTSNKSSATPVAQTAADPNQQRQQPPPVGRPPVGGVGDGQDRQRGRPDRHTAHAGDRHAVDLAGVGDVHQPGRSGRPADQRRDRQRQPGRAGGDGENLLDRCSHRRCLCRDPRPGRLARSGTARTSSPSAHRPAFPVSQPPAARRAGRHALWPGGRSGRRSSASPRSIRSGPAPARVRSAGTSGSLKVAGHRWYRRPPRQSRRRTDAVVRPRL